MGKLKGSSSRAPSSGSGLPLRMDGFPVEKKPKLEHAPPSRKGKEILVVSSDDEEEGATAIDAPAAARAVAGGPDQAGDVQIVAESGQLALRDYPHPRHLCASHPFSSTQHSQKCDKCCCFVCQVPSSECTKWAAGHCHAHDSAQWKAKRDEWAAATPEQRRTLQPTAETYWDKMARLRAEARAEAVAAKEARRAERATGRDARLAKEAEEIDAKIEARKAQQVNALALKDKAWDKESLPKAGDLQLGEVVFTMPVSERHESIDAVCEALGPNPSLLKMVSTESEFTRVHVPKGRRYVGRRRDWGRDYDDWGYSRSRRRGCYWGGYDRYDPYDSYDSEESGGYDSDGYPISDEDVDDDGYESTDSRESLQERSKNRFLSPPSHFHDAAKIMLEEREAAAEGEEKLKGTARSTALAQMETGLSTLWRKLICRGGYTHSLGNELLRSVVESVEDHPQDPPAPSGGQRQVRHVRVRVRVFLADFHVREGVRMGGDIHTILDFCAPKGYDAALAKDMVAACKAASDGRAITAERLMKHVECKGYKEAEIDPAGLGVTLRPYQRRALQFMLDEEASDGIDRHMWMNLEFPVHGGGGGCTTVRYSPALERMEALPDPSSRRLGGFLSEEMGMGKTIEVLALVLADRDPRLQPGGAGGAAGAGAPAAAGGGAAALPPPPAADAAFLAARGGLVPSSATLVVAPVSLVGQWQSEVADKCAAAGLRVHVFHGQGRIRDVKKLSTEFDLVITSYNTMGADFTAARPAAPKPNAPPPKRQKRVVPSTLDKIVWRRVVLDECHTVKQSNTGQSQAALALVTQRRWLLTGTPISTSVDDLLGQFRVLGLRPFDQPSVFEHCISGNRGRARSAPTITCPAGNPVLYLMSKVCMRHTKATKVNGEACLTLPPLKEETIAVEFTKEEKEAYDKMHGKVRGQWGVYKAAGPAHVSKNTLAIMSLALPLRRMCSGGALSDKDLVASGKPAGAQGGGEGAGCCVCGEAPERPMRTPCGHVGCHDCMAAKLESSVLGSSDSASLCPQCSAPCRADQLQDSLEAAAPSPAAAAQGAICMESKLRTLVADLNALRARDPSAKVLIFSQFATSIEWLKQRLAAEGYGFRFINGAMPLRQRAKALEEFRRDPPTTVFLLSIRSGAVGLTLTAASHVVLLEPCLNPALEEQAVGRVHRLGQTRATTVKRLYMRGSIEERIVEMVKARRAAGGTPGAVTSSEVVPGNPPGKPPSGKGRGAAVKVEHLPGHLTQDKQDLKLSEFELLFS